MESVGGGARGPDGLVRRDLGSVLVCGVGSVWVASPAAPSVVQGQGDADVRRHVSNVPPSVMASMAAQRECFGSRCRGQTGVVAGVRGDQHLSQLFSVQKEAEKEHGLALETHFTGPGSVGLRL